MSRLETCLLTVATLAAAALLVIVARGRFGGDAPESLHVSPVRILATRGPDAGSDRAKYELVAFIDYQCAPCKTFHENIPRLIAEFGDHLAVQIRNYPQGELHPLARKAATMAEAARVFGRFDEVSRELFKRDLATTGFEHLSGLAGITKLRIDHAIQGPGAAQVSEDYRLAKALELKMTPSLILCTPNNECLLFRDAKQLEKYLLDSGLAKNCKSA